MTMETRVVKVGDVLIGGNNPVVVQTMCNTHTYDVDATVAQTLRLAKAGAQLVRITVPGLQDVPHVREIKARVRAAGCNVPLVADIHFSSETAIAVASVVEKVRINPGNFHKDHAEARRQFALFLEECKKYGTAIRIGLNHGSLGAYIVEKYGNTPRAMALAAMEWVEMCIDADFFQVVVSLKASNTVVMIEAYRELARMMQERGVVFPLHVGVTEAGNGDSGRIKSCVAISTLLAEGIGNTVRVSLTEDPENELPVAQYLADRYSPQILSSVSDLLRMTDDCHFERSEAESRNLSERDRTILKAACDYGKPLLDRTIDTVSFPELEPAFGAYLADELLQACRRKFYRPEYIACPGCGRTMYNLQEAFEAVKARTGHLKDVVIAVMGCIVNGPGEMADADWGYVGEGGGKVTIYRGKEPVLRHIPDSEAVDKLVELIESEQ
ncbi:MAG: (E)-4-hydroxy-3-methylbut-2-enyl-diphosphate synthase [Bacteroidales bacterium]|nr:(E)-4-hydroxy-3-methylbut-2-enyl-diphosphate synthase [Bacteroidales bacterium]